MGGFFVGVREQDWLDYVGGRYQDIFVDFIAELPRKLEE